MSRVGRRFEWSNVLCTEIQMESMYRCLREFRFRASSASGKLKKFKSFVKKPIEIWIVNMRLIFSNGVREFWVIWSILTISPIFGRMYKGWSNYTTEKKKKKRHCIKSRFVRIFFKYKKFVITKPPGPRGIRKLRSRRNESKRRHRALWLGGGRVINGERE